MFPPPHSPHSRSSAISFSIFFPLSFPFKSPITHPDSTPPYSSPGCWCTTDTNLSWCTWVQTDPSMQNNLQGLRRLEKTFSWGHRGWSRPWPTATCGILKSQRQSMDPQNSSTWALLDGQVAAAGTYQREVTTEYELSTQQAEISACWDITQEELRQFPNALSTVLNALTAHSKDGERLVELKKEGSGLPW